MSNWRPQGWKIPATVKVYPYLDGVQPMTCLDEEDTIIFEAGADAMLEALRNNQLSPFDPTVMQANFKGKVVIIPDDKALDKTSN